jgi:hypothetical protein
MVAPAVQWAERIMRKIKQCVHWEMSSDVTEQIMAKDRQQVVCEPAHFKLPKTSTLRSVECTAHNRISPVIRQNIVQP